ncbi:MAG: XisH family protein [Saprospiraceae bacterium]|nr:XisH family protein [Saprospiraceae bacterium]MCF8251273.1 XisH family protein [Saprospiraceae bacterium]MCF8311810.1 XisH family protein [Saprospiraceae bacterium]MCF8441951.1 XisH family protein [Saprospiraceae bacterium]
MAKDLYHEKFRIALEKDGWTITHDPYPLRVGRIGYEVDFGAEKLLAAEKGNAKIAVELKSFSGPSDVNEFHRAVGQFNDYFVALEVVEPNRVLFLGIPEDVWKDFFQEPIIQKSLERIQAKLVVYNPFSEIILSWIN